MPIKIPKGLPAKSILTKEAILVIEEKFAKKQDIRPIKIAILNLMPNKAKTETQLLRLLGQTPLQIEVDLIALDKQSNKNTPKQHIDSFYIPWKNAKKNKYDGLIVTGAPLEHLKDEEIIYHNELLEIFEWSSINSTRMLLICWAAQNYLTNFFNIPFCEKSEKAFGIFRLKLQDKFDYLARGLDDRFNSPVSRYKITDINSIISNPKLKLLATSERIGPSIIVSTDRRILFCLDHLEYDSDNLLKEYMRDNKKGCKTGLPENYFSDDDISKGAYNRWRSPANLLFRNWIDDVYQATPYDIEKIGSFNLNHHLLR